MIIYVSLIKAARAGGPAISGIKEEISIDVPDKFSTSFKYALNSAIEKYKLMYKCKEVHLFGMF